MGRNRSPGGLMSLEGRKPFGNQGEDSVAVGLAGLTRNLPPSVPAPEEARPAYWAPFVWRARAGDNSCASGEAYKTELNFNLGG